MSSRTYDIELSCGCLISLDGGGGLMPCFSDECKIDEEYLLNPKWVEWELAIFEGNNELLTTKEINGYRVKLEKEFKKRRMVGGQR